MGGSVNRHRDPRKSLSRLTLDALTLCLLIAATAQALTKVRLALSPGHRIVIDGAGHRSGTLTLTPGRHRFRLLKGDAVLSVGWLSVPPGSCTLVDQPRPSCR